MWVNLDFAVDMVAALAGVFDGVEYGYIMVPTYPGGGIGMILGRKAFEGCEVGVCRRPTRLVKEAGVVGTMKYYSGKTHRGAFQLPREVQRRMDEAVAGAEGGEDGGEEGYDDDSDSEGEDEEDEIREGGWSARCVVS